jgi:hypothetical protein
MRHGSTLVVSFLALTAASAGAQTDVMFVTSASGTGNLSTWPQATPGLHGIAAGNSICQNLAAAAGLEDATTFQAWLSDAATDAACNLRRRTGHPRTCLALSIAPGPWARTDGAPFALGLDTLARSEVLNVAYLDEHGEALPIWERVWTGTDEDGTLAGFGGDCTDAGGIGWNNGSTGTGAVGYVQFGPHTWTAHGGSTCSLPGHIYCFQSASFVGPPLAPFESEGALVFRTSTTYTGELGAAFEAGGAESLAAGDAICQARARAGSLPAPGSFRAWLSVVAVDAIDHIDYDGPFKRPDGVQVVSSKAGLADVEVATPIAETELLTYSDSLAWTGTTVAGRFDDRNCFDFTQSDSSVHGVVGVSDSIDDWSSAFTLGCSFPLPLYCFSDQPIFFWSGFEESRGGLWRWSAVEP